MSQITIINLTPHVVRLNDGREFQPSGVVARVKATYQPQVFVGLIDDEDRRGEGFVEIFKTTFSEIEGLPPTQVSVLDGRKKATTEEYKKATKFDGETIYIVSGMVAAAAKRSDVVAPATGHPACVRENGQVVSVPGFVQS